MNIVIVTEDLGIEVYKTWKDVNKYTSFDKGEFTKLGVDYILNCSKETFEIQKDIKTLERVASERVFAKKSFTGLDWCILGTFILTLYSLIS